MVKKKSIAGSLIPDTLVDAGGTYEAAEIKPVKIVEFYDPDFGPENDVGLLSIYDGPRYGGKTLKELKQMCRDRDIPISGTKKAIIDRLDDQNKRLKKKINLKEEIKRNKLIQKARADKVVVDDTVAVKITMIKTRLNRLQRLRLKRLDTLVTAQQAFDKTEADVNDLKVTIKSLESLF
jgi:hypothetical protein